MTADTISLDPMADKGKWHTRVWEVLDVMSGTPRLLGLIWRANPGLCLLVVVLNITVALVPLLEMELAKSILDTITSGATAVGGKAGVMLLLLLGAGLTLLHFLIDPSMWVCQENLADALTRDINLMLLNKANSFVDIAMFETPEFYDKLETAQRQAGYKPINVLHDVCGLVRSVVGASSMLVLLLAYQPLIAIGVVIVALPQMIEGVRYRKIEWKMWNFEVPEVRKMAYYKNILTENHNAKEIRLFNLGQYFTDRYLASFGKYHERHNKLRSEHWRNNMLLSAVSGLGTAGAFIFVALAALSQTITVGSYVLYVGAIDHLRNGVLHILHNLSSLYEANLFGKNLFDFLEIPPTMELPPPEFALKVPREKAVSIEFCDVGFQYPRAEKVVFSALSFKVEPGQTVALVGENGAGKTTIVKLLSRLYDPTCGKILIDGVDLREYDLEQWRANISVILQDYSRYYLSARENIGLGRLELLHDMEAVATAAERGGALDVVEGLPDKYETILGRIFSPELEKGTEISGGQWQKMALSRAFMRSLQEVGKSKNVDDAQLLILDEPTSSLDAQAEYDVFTRFNELTRGKRLF
jgi:ATP-binding cassette subfamily B protein